MGKEFIYNIQYYFLKQQKEDIRDKKMKRKQKVVNKNEKLEEIYQTNQKKSASIEKKLEEGKIRRMQITEKHAQKLQNFAMKEKEKYDKFLENRHSLRQEREYRQKDLLETQVNLIGRSNLKESSITLNRINILYL